MSSDRTLAELDITHQHVETPVDDLRVDGDNPNEQADDTYGHFLNGMRSGWVGGPIVANTGDLPGYDGDPEGLICDGEHRWRAAQDIGRDTVPVTYVDFSDDAERRYWRQHLNKVTGEHDRKRNALEYDQILGEGYTDEIDSLTNAADEDLDELLAEIRMDNGVEAPYEYDPKHNVYFEDCVEGMNERLKENSVDCVVTDPPYGIDWQSNHREEEFDKLDADGNLDDAVELFDAACAEFSRVLKPDGHLYVCTRWDVYSEFQRVVRRYFEERNCLVWAKNNWGMGSTDSGYRPQHEFVIFARGDSPRTINGQHSDLLEYPHPDTTEYDHPTEKPMGLVEELIEASSNPGDTVLDPFMGSGTTAVAAIQNGRDYVGFETDEKNYRDVIERRIGEAKRQRQASVNKESETDD
jgi:DNA modification methylase